MSFSHNQPPPFPNTYASWKGHFPCLHRLTSKNSSTRLIKAPLGRSIIAKLMPKPYGRNKPLIPNSPKLSR